MDIWNIERGFPQNGVLSILQSDDGYIWLGTVEGLVCFDGITFKIYNADNTKELKSNYIYRLYQDRKRNLWIGTLAGGVTCLRDGKFISYKSSGDTIKAISSFVEDKDGNLWVGTFNKGLFKIVDDQISSSIKGVRFPYKRVLCLETDVDGNLWIGTNSGLVKRSSSGDMSLYDVEDGLASPVIYCALETKNFNLWIGTENGLNLLKNGQFKKYGKNEGVSNEKISCIYEDRDSNLWIGTDGGGLIRMNNGEFETLSVDDGLKCGYICSIYEDSEGSLWFGTAEGGLHRLRDTMFTNYTTKEGMAHNKINCVTTDQSGKLKIGSNGGLNTMINGKLELEFSNKNELISNVVRSFLEDKNGGIWVGTEKGLHRFNDGYNDLFTMKEGLSNNYIYCLFEDSNGLILVGTPKGLNQLNKGKQSWWQGYIGLENVKIRTILEGKEGELWIGSEIGLTCRNNDKSFHFTTNDGLISDYVDCIYEDESGTLFIGTPVGLSMFRDNKFTSFRIQDGLINDSVRSILEDDNGNLWISSRAGISCIKKQELIDFADKKIQRINPLHFNEEDGMVSRWFNYSATKTSDGKLWFATDKGLVMVDPVNIKKNSVPPSVIIEGLKADGEMIDLKSSSDPIIIPPGKRRLEFQYTALSFRRPKRVKFKYILEGYDRQWHDMGNTRSTSVASLSPGKYTFRVIACNDDGVWNNEGDSLSFYVEPYFYQTTWFYIFLILFAATAIFSGYRYRIRQLIARKRELRSLVDLRTRDLNERTIQLEKAHHSLQESKKIIEIKNQKITSSIEYAQRIQEAVLPTDERMRKCLVDYFIIYEPKDIVSGDFYWFHRFENHRFLIATADCTGHGVPGAILSMIGCMTLDEIVNKAGIYDPQQILYFLHLGVRGALKQEEGYSKPHDGMDMALCLVDLNEGKIIFSGAKRPLYCIIDSELLEIKGNKKSIGGRQKEVERTFESNEIKFQSEITLYLTSDGFADQNDRENNKYGSPRLREFLAAGSHLDLEEQKKRLLEEFQRHRGDEEQRDDVTIIGIKLKKGECL